MPKYAVLLAPGHNRVYFEESKKLAISELEIAALKIRSKLKNYKLSDIAGIDYITFESDDALSGIDLNIISRLSFVYALYELSDLNGSFSLKPIAKDAVQVFDTDIGGMLKYSGKTNELFTKMMINTALNSCDCAEASRTRLLDPVAGKGTTLFEAAMMGIDAYGIEISSKLVSESQVFFKKFLEKARFKHTYAREKTQSMSIHKFEFAKTKEDMKSAAHTLVMADGDAKYTGKCFKKDFFDIITGDLPYGIAHGNKSSDARASKTRSPGELLSECLPHWRDVLKPGGAIVLSWNAFVLPKEPLREILRGAGFRVLEGGPYERFAHRVDQAIKRDVAAATKP